MKVMDTIKKGFEIASKNLNLVLVVFIFNLLWNWGVAPFAPEAPEGIGPGVTMSPGLIAVSIIFVLLSIFIQGGVLGSVKDAVKDGKLALNKFAGYGGKFYIRLLSLAIIMMLVVGVIGFLAAIIIAAAAPTANAALVLITTIIALGLVGLGLYAVLLLFMSPYVLVIEDASVMDAIRGSIAFVKKIILKVLALGALLVLIGFGVGVVIGLIAGLLSLIFKGIFLQLISGTISGGVNAFLTVLVTSSLATYYLAMKSTGTGKTEQGS